MSALTEEQLGQVSHRHPSWPWALGMVVGCIVACFVTGIAMASDVRKDAKEQIAAEKAQREKDIAAVLDQLALLRQDAARNERKLDEVLARLETRGRR